MSWRDCWRTRASGGSAESIAARRRGEEYLPERNLFRRNSTGEVADPDWLRFSFPTHWHYDVLRALEYFRAVGDPPDKRLDEAVELLRSKQQPDGTWPFQVEIPTDVVLGAPITVGSVIAAVRQLRAGQLPSTVDG